MNDPAPAPKSLLRPMPPRNPNEAHRAATPLELLFDLVSVIAIAAAAAGLHHAIAENHSAQGAIRFAMAFFAIWWAWMNFTWFASAYDNDDTVFRLLTMVIMTGALITAAGIGPLMASLDISLAIAGYILMRLAMIALWLRAARNDPAGAPTALRYAIGIAIAQLYWISLHFITPGSETKFYGLFAIGVVLELVVPVVAERKSTTPWHRHHMMERYGLLTIIVLGETLLAGSMALGEAAGDHFDTALVPVALSALVTLFGMWWLYFAREEHLQSDALGRALIWGYGHAILFASGAAVGAGFAVMVDIVTHHAHASALTGAYAVAIPVAVFLFGLWFVRDRFVCTGANRFTLPVFALLMLAAPHTPFPLEAVAGLTVLSVILRNRLAQSPE